MFSPLLQSIIERENIAVLTEDNIDEFLEQHKEVALFFTGDYERLVESNDVAVIFPEIIKAFRGRITPAVIDRRSERQLQLRYLFNAFPTLVFLREGEYLGVISRVMDWNEYIVETSQILSKEPSKPPAFQFPEGCAPAGLKQ